MIPNSAIRRSLTHTFIVAALLSVLAACDKPLKTEGAPANEPTISKNTVSFPSNSSLKQSLTTLPVISSQENIVNFPARIAWDEDHTARISSPISGRLVDVLVLAGTPVKVNQALAHLSSPDMGSAQADVAKARSDLAQAERNYSRNKDLAEAGVIAGKDFEQSQTDLLSSKAEAARTEVKLRSFGATNDVDQKFTIKSPIAGMIVERNTNPGMEWRSDQASLPLFIVSDPTYLWCWIDAPEQAISSIHKDMQVTLRSSAWPNEVFNAKVDFIEGALDPVSHTLKVRAKLRNLDLKLKSEMYLTAQLSKVDNTSLDIPTKAVFLNESTKMIFVKTSEGVYTRKVIVPIASNDEWVSVSSGLNKGDEVVVDGALFLEKLIEENKSQTAQSIDASKPVKLVQVN
jgi:cobalt-zinc-cadmium efflux system membrane fusion protein